MLEPETIAGSSVITLACQRRDDRTPQFVSAEVLPARGMMTHQIRAILAGQGEINLLSSPPSPVAPPAARDPSDVLDGNDSLAFGAAILLPFANRIRGQPSSDRRTIATRVAGRNVTMPANWTGSRPGAERHASHGFLLASRFDVVEQINNASESSVRAKLRAGDFDQHWLSRTDVDVRLALRSDAVELTIAATNRGNEMLPMGIGWHPHFVIPSGQRQQARLHLPAQSRVLVNNYDEVFPTGEVVPVAGTSYDFRPIGGVPLRDTFFDDAFTDIDRGPQGEVVATLVDPAAHFGLRIIALSPQIGVFQLYAPPDKNFVALEPQFNLADPYSPAWGARPTGMVELSPGESVSYCVRLELFSV